MSGARLYHPTQEEMRAFYLSFDRENEEHFIVRQMAYDQAVRTGKTAFECYLAIARSL